MVVQFLQENNGKCVCIFVNTRTEAFHISTYLEKKLDEASIRTDVMLVHGHLDKNKKIWLIRLFCNSARIEGINPDVLLSTLATNVGVDNPRVSLVMCFGWPRNLLTWF